MQITYLCAKHTEWVYSHPAEARHYLERDEHQGRQLSLAGRYCECIPYLGCAFDIAALLLEMADVDNADYACRLASLAVCLSQAYCQVQALDYAVGILYRAVGVLGEHGDQRTQSQLREYLRSVLMTFTACPAEHRTGFLHA